MISSKSGSRSGSARFSFDSKNPSSSSSLHRSTDDNSDVIETHFHFRKGRRDSTSRFKSESSFDIKPRSRAASPLRMRKAITDLSGVHPKRKTSSAIAKDASPASNKKGHLKRASTAASIRAQKPEVMKVMEDDKDWFTVRPVSAVAVNSSEDMNDGMNKLKKTDSILAKERFLEDFLEDKVSPLMASPKITRTTVPNNKQLSSVSRPKTAPTALSVASGTKDRNFLNDALKTKSLSKSQFRRKRFEKEAKATGPGYGKGSVTAAAELSINYGEILKRPMKVSIPPLNSRSIKTQHAPQAMDKFRIEQITLRRLKYVYEKGSKVMNSASSSHKDVNVDHWAMLQLLEYSKVPIAIIQKYFPTCNTFHDLKDLFTERLLKKVSYSSPAAPEHDGEENNEALVASIPDMQNNQWANVPIWVLKKVVSGMESQFRLEDKHSDVSAHDREVYEQAKDMLRAYEEDEKKALLAAQQARDQYEKSRRASTAAVTTSKGLERRFLPFAKFDGSIINELDSNSSSSTESVILSNIAATIRPKTAPIKLNFAPTPDWIVHLKVRGASKRNLRTNASYENSNKPASLALNSIVPSGTDQQWIKDLVISRSMRKANNHYFSSNDLHNHIKSLDFIRP